MKNIITITGIRPDFIRMSSIFKKLDENFNHTLIHTGQHYDTMLSDVFFDELKLRKPDYNLAVGGPNKEHFHQTSELSIKIIELIRSFKIKPDIILFLGDSNSAVCSLPLKKEGYTIGHIEAGMRSYDKRMLEELNRTVCDHCSNYHFVYHKDYKTNLINENLNKNNIFVVGNTIVEVCKDFSIQLKKTKKLNNKIILDIHRPENFKDITRLTNIVKFANNCSEKYRLPVYMLNFHRTIKEIVKYKIDLNKIQLIPLMSYKTFLKEQYHSLFTISDSGTGQEEPSLLDTPVIVPRDFTERPQSVKYNCSYMIDVNTVNSTWNKSLKWLFKNPMNNSWLGKGNTSDLIIEKLKHL